MEGRVLTCVYCGQEYPQETPAWGNEVLTEHIRVCPKHPMRKAEADIALLRGALAGLVGASDKAELEKMELAMRVLPAPAADKIASINAIHALLATLPNASAQPKQEAPDNETPVTYETYTHICCYHDTAVARLTAPPQWEEKCCHCGNVRWRRNALTVDPQLHGPFLPRGRSSQALPQEG